MVRQASLNASLSMIVCLSLAGCGAQSHPEASRVPNSPIVESQVAPDQPSTSEIEYVGTGAKPPGKQLNEASGTLKVPAVDGPLIPNETSPGDSLDHDPTSASEQKALSIGEPVEVFFATDRLPTSQLMPGVLRTLLPAFSVGLLCCALLIGLLNAKRFQVFWLMGCGLSVCLGLITLQVCIVRWQQQSQLASNAATRFSTLRYDALQSDYPLYVGAAKVSLPRIHLPGQFESPSLFRLEFTESPERHIVLHSVDIAPSLEAWFEQVSDRAKLSAEREGFIFVHGFNVRFADALKRTAQLAVDLEIKGPAISYSWPSRGQLSAYSADEASVSWSAPHFERLLVDLRERTTCRTFNVVAHSMGNRALLEAIERINLRNSGDGARDANSQDHTRVKWINELVLAAPDVDARMFDSRYQAALQQVVGRATIYFSDQDRALQLSSKIHSVERLGLQLRIPPSSLELESVHVGRDGFLSLGHSYYGSDQVVLADMRRLLNDNTPADQREHLKQVDDAQGNRYFQLDRTMQSRVKAKVLR